MMKLTANDNRIVTDFNTKLTSLRDVCGTSKCNGKVENSAKV